MPTANLKKLRDSILSDRGTTFSKGKRQLITFDDLPSIITKTQMMKYLELKFSAPIEELIYQGSIYQTAAKLGVDPSTVSKWRKMIEEIRIGLEIGLPLALKIEFKEVNNVET